MTSICERCGELPDANDCVRCLGLGYTINFSGCWCQLVEHQRECKP